jgi:Adenylate cyclase, family 3 (some proteins contain HAMP domain)
MHVDKDEILDFARGQAAMASLAADEAGIVENLEKYARKQLSGAMIGDVPSFTKIKVGYAAKAWASILFVDMRKSSQRALKFGPRTTFITMHTFLPTMAKVVVDCEGVIVGYRGDGLFAAFGLTTEADQKKSDELKQAIQTSYLCGKAMLEAVDVAITPALEDEIEGFQPFNIGCGIDCGHLVVTRIGLNLGSELTAYGVAVNKAAKLCSDANHEVIISDNANELMPTTKGGTLGVLRNMKGRGGFVLRFPSDYRIVE